MTVFNMAEIGCLDHSSLRITDVLSCHLLIEKHIATVDLFVNMHLLKLLWKFKPDEALDKAQSVFSVEIFQEDYQSRQIIKYFLLVGKLILRESAGLLI